MSLNIDNINEDTGNTDHSVRMS